ncbi:intercellular trafficking and secretion [Sporothrix epigloea]|uniref:Sorting nexin-4 n=1 Tax=Sporothrix epigloea TaxID=1892477 RepID=A0ABP0D7B8_9PEZI
MAVIDQDNFSNISWNSDQRTDEGASANDNAGSRSKNKNSISQDVSADSRTRARMSDDNGFAQPLSPGGESRQKLKLKQEQKQKQKQKQKQTDSGVGFRAGTGEETTNYDFIGHDINVLGPEVLQCRVSSPLTENEGGSNPFTSYLVMTTKQTVSVRRRFTDFLYLYNSLSKDFPACAVPPIPDKQRMVRVTGDRFGPDFTNRRAYSLQRFLFRLSLHPVLRRAPLLHNFLESGEWNATMRSHSVRLSYDGGSYSTGVGGTSGGSGGGSGSEQGVTSSMFDTFADSFINVFTKVHRLDRRFVEVREKSDRLDEDLNHVEKVVARVVRRETDLESDLKDLAEQFQKLITLEPGVEDAVRAFAASVEDTAAGLRGLREVTDQDYLGSLRDMVAYSGSLKNLLKAREQKQLDFEQLTEYLNKSTADRDHLAMTSGGYYHSSLGPGGSGSISGPRRDSSIGGGSGGVGDVGSGSGGGGAGPGPSQSGGSGGGGSSSGGVGAVTSYVTGGGGGALAGASGFLRSKLEDVRGVDHEQSRRERQRKLELRVEELTDEVERAKKTSELFDEEVVKEVADFERIKRVEFKRQLGILADAHMAYYDGVASVWEAYVKELEKDGVLVV